MSCRRLIAACLCLLLWSVSARALPYGSGASDPSVVIGFVATLTGPSALAGQDMADGASLALKQLGGRFANQEVRLVVADDKGSPDVARQQVAKLMERERLDLVMTAVSVPSLLTILPRLVDSGLFVLNLDQAPANLAGAQCSPFLFNMAPPTDGPHEALGQYLTAQGARRIVVVAPDTQLAASSLTALKRTFMGEIIQVLSPKRGEVTFQRELDAIARSYPDAVYSLLTGGMGGAFIRAWGESPMSDRLAFFPVGNAVERPLLPAMGDAVLELKSIGSWSQDLDNPANRRFSSDFEGEYGRPASTWAAQGYDAIMLLDSALKSTNGRTGNVDAVRSGLRRAEFASVRGFFKFNTNQSPVLNYYLRKVGMDGRGRPTHETQSLVLKEWRDHQAPSCPMRWVEEPTPPPAVKKP